MKTKVLSEITINDNIETVYNCYFDIQKWEYVLSDVLDVNIISDTENYQEFTMLVYKNFQKEQVHSRRFCIKNKMIRLEQIVPPPQVISMSGEWEFVPLGDKQTLVKATREFEIKDLKNLDEYSTKLLNSLRQNLLHFKNYIEKVGIIEVSLKIPAKIEIVQQQFWDISAWNKIWTKVNNTKINFDNGFLQDFFMDVERGKRTEQIRTIQEKLPDGDILLYSILPPDKLCIHHGSWSFVELGDSTGLICKRVFRMTDEYQSEFSDYKYKFQCRLRQVLEAFQTYYLEETDVS